jgi:hypothetical protein
VPFAEHEDGAKQKAHVIGGHGSTTGFDGLLNMIMRLRGFLAAMKLGYRMCRRPTRIRPHAPHLLLQHMPFSQLITGRSARSTLDAPQRRAIAENHARHVEGRERIGGLKFTAVQRELSIAATGRLISYMLPAM